jgi:hypothetical protein
LARAGRTDSRSDLSTGGGGQIVRHAHIVRPSHRGRTLRPAGIDP